jgi:hypothetical protein
MRVTDPWPPDPSHLLLLAQLRLAARARASLYFSLELDSTPCKNHGKNMQKKQLFEKRLYTAVLWP